MPTGTIPGCSGLAALALAVSAGQAQITGYYLSSQDYHYRIAGVPDFDQRRDAGAFGDLPVPGLQNGGSMYCGPVASMNALAFLANEIFPQMRPGARPWQEYTAYSWDFAAIVNNSMLTFAIEDLATLQGTDPEDGTNMANMRDGLEEWIETYGGPAAAACLDVSLFGYSGTAWTVSQPDIVRASDLPLWGLDGSIIVLGYGRYDIEPPPSLAIKSRTGGHYVTLTAAEIIDGVAYLRYRDPSSSDSTIQQDVFRTRTQRVLPLSVRGTNGVQHVRDALINPGQNLATMNWSSVRMIDRVIVITPVYGLTVEIGIPKLVPLPNVSLGSAPGQLAAPPGTHTEQAELSPDRRFVLSIVRNPATGGSETWLLDRAAGTETAAGFIKFDGVRGEVIDAEWTRQRRLALVDGEGLTLHDPFSQRPQEPYLHNTLSDVLTSVAADDAADELVLTTGAGELIRLDAATLRETSRTPVAGLPADIADLAIDPRSGRILFTTASGAAGWIKNAGEPEPVALLLPAVQSAREAARRTSCTADGAFLITSPASDSPTGFRVWAWRFNQQDEIVPDPEHPFDGIVSGESFKVTRGRSSIDPAAESELPGPLHIDPETIDREADVSDCAADHDGDGAVTVMDLLAYLGAFRAGDWRADLDADGQFAVEDLLAFLAAFRSGCGA